MPSAPPTPSEPARAPHRDPYRALVIGAAGNVGTRLVEHLRAHGHPVLEADIKPGWRDGYLMADITHPLDLVPAFDWRPDVVFHLAAAVGRMTCAQAGSLAVTTNLAGLNNVVQLTRRAGARLVYFSTSEVYGSAPAPQDEARSVPQPNNRYGLSKWLGEQLVEYEVRHEGLSAVTVRPCMFYDERETVGDHRSAMIRFAAHLARGEPITVHAGSARGWLHTADAVRAVAAARRVRDYAAINLGHPDVVPTTVLAEMVRAELDADPALVRVTAQPPHMTPVKHPALARQRTLLGFTPRVGLVEGVARVCAVQRRMAAAERLEREAHLAPPAGPAGGVAAGAPTYAAA